MTLRRRLLLTIAATAVPLVALGVWLRVEASRRAWQQALRDVAAARVEQWGRGACEAEPDDPPGPAFRRRPTRFRDDRPESPEAAEAARRWAELRRRGGPSRVGMRLFAYDRAYHAADPEAPPFPPELRSALASEDVVVTEAASDDGERRPLVGVRTGWDDGPCAFVLARGTQPIASPPLAGLLTTAALLAAGFLIAVWITTGSAVRRIRALTTAVRRSSAAHYETPVGPQGTDEIGELARAFDEAAAEVRGHVSRVESREATLRSFVANTTHDVMLPLTVLQGHLAALQRAAADGRVTPEIVKDASEEAHYMASLVHNLGAAAKLEAGETQVERHPVNLNELVERAIARHRPVAGPRGIEINGAVPEPALWTAGDVTLIEQAVSNAVHNAVRYNRPGGHVAVVLEPADGERFRLRVFDDGPGVPDEQLARLTERRYRADDARTRAPGGQGLGLSIAREVALRHRFALDLRRSEAGGLEVELSGPTTPSRA
ncbi:MAG: HAMP domain-containing sensor histidine kinase [Vicinamibacteria bacterium]